VVREFKWQTKIAAWNDRKSVCWSFTSLHWMKSALNFQKYSHIFHKFFYFAFTFKYKYNTMIAFPTLEQSVTEWTVQCLWIFGVFFPGLKFLTCFFFYYQGVPYLHALNNPWQYQEQIYQVLSWLWKWLSFSTSQSLFEITTI
jgi:hypothetical protein